MSDLKSVGFVRISQLMVQMMDAVDEGDKVRLVKLSQHFAEDAEDFVGVLLEEAGVTDNDMDKILPTDEETEQLLKDAASSQEIKTAQIKE